MKKSSTTSPSQGRQVLEGRFEKIPINKLKPHEEILESRLPEIIAAIKEGKLSNGTILVSYPHYIILDGHHRVAALRKLGAKKIPAYVTRYVDNHNIQVGTWYPTMQWSFSWDWALEELKSNLGVTPIEIKLSRYRLEQELQEQEEIKNYFIFIPWKTINLPSVQGYVIPVAQRKVIDVLKDLGGRIDFLPTLENAITTATERKTFFLARRTPNKSDVIKAALSKKLFAPKTTRHILLQEIPKRNLDLTQLIRKISRPRYKTKIT